MNTLEQQAALVGASRGQLRRRLNEARSVLTERFRAIFKGATFDHANRRLLSRCGHYALQWLLRDRPDAPESSDNQQTNRGTVVVLLIKEHAS